MAIGNYEQVHGWNLIFRDVPTNNNAPRFHAFNMHATRAGWPDTFHNIPVGGQYLIPIASDHQGHIIPQNLLALILDPIANAAFLHQPASLVALDAFLTLTYPNLNFNEVTNYINNSLIANGAPPNLFLDSTANDAEDYLGGYFSVIMWNPINICRAPMDGRRGGTPGNTVDMQVINHLLQFNSFNPGMTATFQAMPAIPANQDIENFIAASNSALAILTASPSGYYQFDWMDDPHVQNVLIPS